MNLKFSQLSLADKLTTLTLLLTCISSFSILSLVYFFIVRINNNYSEKELASTKVIIDHIYREPMWNFDQNLINQLSDSLLDDEGYAQIKTIKIIDSNKKIIYSKSKANAHGLNLSSFENNSFDRYGVVKIQKDNQELGEIEFIFSNESAMMTYKKYIASILFFALIMISITGFWIYFFFNNLLTKPLKQLLDHTKLLENEKYEIINYKNSTQEFGIIGNTLNGAANMIKKRNYELHIYNENLENKILERSMELEEQISKNINAARLVSVGEVASGIAHEINNPLTVISGQVAKIRRTLTIENSTEQIEQSLIKISLMIERIVKIISGLKNISRDGQADPMKSFSVSKMIDEIKLLIEMKIKNHDISFTLDIDHSIENVMGREVQISQVLVNLLNNAVDAIGELSDRWIKIEITNSLIEDKIVFKITDSGKGIPKELIDKIMNPFFTTKEVGKGTGLGLSISKGIITEHGGDFYINEKSENTQFVFTLKRGEL